MIVLRNDEGLVPPPRGARRVPIARRRALRVAVLGLALGACGSGGSGGSGGPDDSNDLDVPDVGDVPAASSEGPELGAASVPVSRSFDDLAAAARAGYTGETEPAALDATVTGTALETLIAGPTTTTPARPGSDHEGIFHGRADGLAGLSLLFPLNASPAAQGIFDDDLALGTGVTVGCAGGGTWSVHRDGHAGVLDASRATVSMDGCDPSRSDRLMTGRVEVARDDVDETRWSRVGYDDVLVVGRGRRLRVTGTVTETVTGRCNEDVLRESTLLMTDVDTSEQRLLDAVVRGIDYPDDDDESCSGTLPVTLGWTGRMFLSDSGRVDARTPSPPDLTGGPPRGPPGRVELSGADGTGAVLSVLSLEGDDDTVLLSATGYARLDVTGADGETTSIVSLPEALRGGALFRLGDRDGDGLPDGYELHYGLDPDDPGDATIPNDDGDELTPLEEFLGLGDPSGPVGPAEDSAADVALELAVSIDPATGEQRVVPGVTIDAPSSWTRFPPRRTFRLELVGGRWLRDGSSGICAPILGPDPSIGTLECTILSADLEWPGRVEGLSAVGRADADGPVEVRLSLLAPDFATPHATSTASASVDYERRPDPAFALEAPGLTFGDADTASRLLVGVVQPALARAVDVRLRADPPPGIEFVSAELFSSGSQAPLSRCVTGTGLVCAMPEVRPGDALSLELRYLSTEPGDHPIEWRLDAPADADVAGAFAVTTVRHANSMAPLQALIDAAADGDAVTLPPGTYTGTLHGRGRRIDVRGADGDERTVLVSVDRDAPIAVATGSRTTWSNIDWRTTGAPLVREHGSDVTISDSTIEPVADLPHDVRGLLPPRSNYRLHANRISGFGAGEEGRCETLVIPSDGGYTRGSTYVQHNLFVDNDCDSVMRFGSEDPRGRSRLIANNNTFVGSPRIVEIVGADRNGETLRFRNNLVVGADSVIAMSETRFTATGERRPTLVTSRNVVWNGLVESALRADRVSRPGVRLEGADLAAEPAFVDEIGGDYRLRPDSALIDAGVEPDEYAWDYHDPADAPSPGADAVTRAVDGDGDGVAEHDVGAFEYRP